MPRGMDAPHRSLWTPRVVTTDEGSGGGDRRRWRLRVRVEWKRADCWIGVFCPHSPPGHYSDETKNHIWICIVPMLPIHIWWQDVDA